MTEPFKAIFDQHAATYAQYRPGYPAELFAFIVSQAPDKQLAWDCGTGSGQAAVALAEFFHHVVATDASAAQLEHAQRLSNIEYRCNSAEEVELADRSIDLVTVANAVHWFDINKFFFEVQRVLKPGGVIAVWCYSGEETADRAVDQAIKELRSLVLPYWAAPIAMVQQHYNTLQFPFEEIESPQFSLSVTWNIRQFIGYVSTWSVREAYRKVHGTDPIEEWASQHKSTFADKDKQYEFHFPLHLRLGRSL